MLITAYSKTDLLTLKKKRFYCIPNYFLCLSDLHSRTRDVDSCSAGLSGLILEWRRNHASRPLIVDRDFGIRATRRKAVQTNMYGCVCAYMCITRCVLADIFRSRPISVERTVVSHTSLLIRHNSLIRETQAVIVIEELGDPQPSSLVESTIFFFFHSPKRYCETSYFVMVLVERLNKSH